jgi:hypothetical protein
MALDFEAQAILSAPLAARLDVAPPSGDTREVLQEALALAHKVEDLLEEARSTANPTAGQAAPGAAEGRARHSTRMARAIAASLIDELEGLAGTARRGPNS